MAAFVRQTFRHVPVHQRSSSAIASSSLLPSTPCKHLKTVVVRVAKESGATPSSSSDAACSYASRNTSQLDQLLSGLSQLRQKQQQGLPTGAEDEDELEDEFEAGQEGVEWVWWRAAHADAAADVTSSETSSAGPDGAATKGRSSSSSDGGASEASSGYQQAAVIKGQPPSSGSRARSGDKAAAQPPTSGGSTGGAGGQLNSARPRRRRTVKTADDQ